MADGTIGSIRLGKGVDVRDFVGALEAMDGLVKEVAEEMGHNPDDFVLKVGPGRWVCDGCDCEKPDDAAGWLEQDGLDWCPQCQEAGAAPVSEGGADA
jgi:hypothetical protein